MCFGGSNNDAKKALKYQKQQAAEAARLEAERQARLKEGVTTINGLFDGAPVMGERDANYDWAAFNDAAAKAAAAAAQSNNGPVGKARAPSTPGDLRDAGSGGGNGQNAQYLKNKNSSVPKVGGGGADPFKNVTLPEGYKVVRGKGGWQIVGPDGKVYKSGDQLSYKEKYDTGAKSGGFGEDFYGKYRDASLGYYEPELEKQYTKAKSNLTFDHARAGTLQSSMSSENLADLVYQNTMNEALVRSKADNATTQLKNSVAAQKTNALTQLYATEDPTVAANTATNSVRTLQNTTPEFAPLGQLFSNAVVGATGYASGYNDQRNWGATPSGSGSGGSGRVVM